MGIGRASAPTTLLGIPFLQNRFIRFIVVGAANTAIGYGLYLALLYLTIPYWAAWAGALTLNVVIAFFLTGSLVFGVLGTGQFIYYVACWLAIAGLNVFLLKVLVNGGVDPKLAPTIMIPINIVLAFVVQKTIVFRKATDR
jgi:putative flippase GtrA